MENLEIFRLVGNGNFSEARKEYSKLNSYQKKVFIDEIVNRQESVLFINYCL